MEDYIPIEDLYGNPQTIKPKSKDDSLSPFMKFGKASFIIWKAVWFVITKTLKGMYNGLLALNNAIDNARKSETGKAMMKKYEQENKQGFSFGQPPQKQNKKQRQNKSNPLGWGF